MRGTLRQEELLRRAVGGDRIALTVVLAEVRPHLVAAIDRRIPHKLRPYLDADDIVQEAFCSIFQRIGDLEPGGVLGFRRWVTTIAMRKLITQLRHYRAVRRGGGRARVDAPVDELRDSVAILLGAMGVDTHTPSQSAIRHEVAASIHAAMDVLPEDRRRAVKLVYLDNKSMREAAVHLGRSVRTIRRLCRDAKAQLADLLESLAVRTPATQEPSSPCCER